MGVLEKNVVQQLRQHATINLSSQTAGKGQYNDSTDFQAPGVVQLVLNFLQELEQQVLPAIRRQVMPIV